MTGGPAWIAAGGPPPLPVSVRLEAPGDEPAVRAVNLAAFAGPEEADIVDAIRTAAPAGWLSLVATDAAGDVVGHLLLSPCAVEAEAGATVGSVLAIGPVAVLPVLQYRGVGSALMASATSLAVARAVPALVLLGHPAYYPRFGFESARGVGLRPPDERWPDAAWMARRLPAWTEAMRGIVRYPEAFAPFA